MTREWKPGDVAMVSALNKPEPYRAFYDGSTWRQYDGAMFCVDSPQSYRPLVVIDPEDREQVERLWQMWRDLAPDHRLAQDNLQVVLREFASPTPPKPEEPTGLGAVVEDSAGTKWLRHDSVPLRTCWLNTDDCQTRYRAWDEINVVRVLSEGVQP